jgi:hypothetical protein
VESPASSVSESAVSENQSYTEINMSHIRVGGGVAGLVFTFGTVFIFVTGLPAVRTFLLWSLVAGPAISIALHFFHQYKPTRQLPKISL